MQKAVVETGRLVKDDNCHVAGLACNAAYHVLPCSLKSLLSGPADIVRDYQRCDYY